MDQIWWERVEKRDDRGSVGERDREIGTSKVPKPLSIYSGKQPLAPNVAIDL